MQTWLEVKRNITTDKKINSFKSWCTLKNYRIAHYFFQKSTQNKRWSILLKIRLMYNDIISTILNLNSQISYKAQVGEGIKLPHSGDGVVISSKAIIGNEVLIYHQVTIGVNEAKKDAINIIIGNNCVLSVGCKVISCRVGDNCRIGPNAVVYKDMIDNSLCVTECDVKQGYYIQ